MILIDAEELLKKVDVSRFENNHKTVEGRMVHNGEHHHFYKMITEAPAVDAQLMIHAKWVPSDVPDSMLSKCTHCGFDTGASIFNYCPNCGAKMDEGK